MKENILYVLKADNAIKIGITNNLKSRIKMLQTGNPYKIHIVNIYIHNERIKVKHLEKLLHKKYRHLRLKGEWFRYNNTIIKEIDNFVISFDFNKIDFNILNKKQTKRIKKIKEKEYKYDKYISDKIIKIIDENKRYHINELRSITYRYLSYNNIMTKEELNEFINQKRLSSVLKLIKPYFEYRRTGKNKDYVFKLITSPNSD